MFAFKINYTTAEYTDGGKIKPLFNGNISETFWQTESDGQVRKYGYQYDQLNRLQKALYQKPGESTAITNSYNESLWYDKNRVAIAEYSKSLRHFVEPGVKLKLNICHFFDA